jgi:F-type H+-transporting ATPase subunit b
MALIEVGVGLLFWMVLAFSIVLFLLSKFAWKPIMKALHDREKSIEDALHSADKAREEMQNLQADNEKLLQQAKEERDEILKEARKIKNEIVEKSREEASAERERILAAAREDIHHEKMAVITELKNQIATISIEIAEQVLREELSGSDKQKELINKLIDEVELN